ncbi:MAG: hypothetical protein Q4Q17_02710, partial [Tissierellia bacterium]|nr:hypothetical protein [Tissierellia bacterium]
MNVKTYRIVLIVLLTGIFCILQIQNILGEKCDHEFEQIYKTQLRGRIKMIGNTLQEPATLLETNKLNNNDYTMKFADKDSDTSTESSSSAWLELKDTVRVKKAFLVWGGTMNKEKRTSKDVCNTTYKNGSPSIEFKTPGMTDYEIISAKEFHQITCEETRCAYVAYADVTEKVKEKGTYWGANIDQVTGGSDLYGGWSLIVVLEDEDLPLHDITIFFGHVVVSPEIGDRKVKIEFGRTPYKGDVKAKLGFITWDGDRNFKGDQVFLDGQILYDDLSEKQNFFNSSITDENTFVPDNRPNYNMSIDIKRINIDTMLKNDIKETTLNFLTTYEWYYPTVLTSEIELADPAVTIEKTVESSNRLDTVENGDILTYTIKIKNDSITEATNVTMEDRLPEEIEYIEGTMVVSPNSAPATIEKNRKISVQIDSLKPSETVELTFKTKVTKQDLENGVTNIAYVRYKSSKGDIEKSSVAEIGVARPDFIFEKTADRMPSHTLTAGDKVVYKFFVKNTGNTPLSDIKIEDPKIGLDFVDLKSTLEPGGEKTIVATYTVSREDGKNGEIINTA